MRPSLPLLLAVVFAACADDEGSVKPGASGPEDAQVPPADAGAASVTDARTADAAPVVTLNDARMMSPLDASADSGDLRAPSPDAEIATAPDPGKRSPPFDASFEIDAAMTSADDHDAAPDAQTDSGSETDTAMLRQVIEKLTTCNVVGDGPYTPRAIEDGFDRCIARCELAASCAALRTTLCGGVDDDLINCIQLCNDQPEQDGLPCGDDFARRAWVCDQTSDCKSGEDEAGCGSHTCADGQALKISRVRCDGVAQCDDRSDEQGCAAFCP